MQSNLESWELLQLRKCLFVRTPRCVADIEQPPFPDHTR
jgi:hypothetical protein